MTGWRVGWLVVPEALVRPIERLAQNLYISPPWPKWQPSVRSMGWRSSRPTSARARESRAPARGPSQGRARPHPSADGAFYLYADVGGLTGGQRRLPQRCSRTSASPPRPASTSTPSAGAFAGFCYAGTTADMAEAARRLAELERSPSRHEGALVPRALSAGLRACFALVGHGLPLALLADLADLHGLAGPWRSFHGRLGHE